MPEHAESVRLAVERVAATQARCGTKLVQVPADWVWTGPKFEAGDVDLEYLVKDILDAARMDGTHPAACGPRCRSQHTDDHSQCPEQFDGDVP